MKCRNCSRELPDNAIFCCWCGKRQLKEKERELKVPAPRQLASGSWFGRISVGGQRVSVTAATEEEYYVRARAMKAGLLDSSRPENRTVRACIEAYVRSASSRLSPTTVQGYESILSHSFPSLLDRRVSTLTRSILQQAVDAECAAVSPRTGKPYSPKTIANRYGLIATVLHEAAPALDTAIRLPEQKDRPIRLSTPEEIYAAVRGTEIELPVLLSIWLSFSMSELRGLTKSGSIHGNQISVAETVVDVHGEARRKSGGKEQRRSRTLTIPPYIQQLIEQVPGDIICPLSGQAMYKRFTRALEKAGLPHMSFHQLRHINASVMAELRIPEKEANDRGGWKSDHIRKRVYTHSFSDTRQAADQAIDEFFFHIIGNESKKS